MWSICAGNVVVVTRHPIFKDDSCRKEQPCPMHPRITEFNRDPHGDLWANSAPFEKMALESRQDKPRSGMYKVKIDEMAS